MTDDGEVAYLSMDYSPTGYGWPFGGLFSFSPSAGHHVVLNYGFLYGQPLGYYGAEYSWWSDGARYQIGQPSGAWLYRDPQGDIWRVMTGRRTDPVDDRRTIFVFEPFGRFDLDIPYPSMDLPRPGMVVYTAESDWGGDYWPEAIDATGSLSCGVFAAAVDSLAVAISGTPGQPDMEVDVSSIFPGPVGVWTVTHDDGTAANPSWSKYRLAPYTMIVGGAVASAKETVTVEVTGNDSTVTLTLSGGTPAACTQAVNKVFQIGGETWDYAAEIKVTDDFVLLSASEVQDEYGDWSWSMDYRVDRTYSLDVDGCQAAADTHVHTGYQTLHFTGAGRLSTASADYQFVVPIYVWPMPESGAMFSYPVAVPPASSTRSMTADFSRYAYGGTLLGAMERCYDSDMAFDIRRRGKMVAPDLVIPAGVWTTGSHVDGDAFSFDPITGDIMEEPGDIGYYWVGRV